MKEKYKEIMRDSLFTSHENRKGLQDLEEFVQNLTIEINASNYNPVDHL